jgi:hypothetical protein
MFIEPKLVKVLIEWENMVDNDTLLVISSPNGMMISWIKNFFLIINLILL